jgi:uncharacterized protein YyaL (SSP411 family)
MERESFENPEVARLLNQSFIAIKVDREERPDIDAIYMMALNVQGHSGGWPLSMFLTQDGKPIVGGTYWPPEDKETKLGKAPGFKSVLKLIRDLQLEKPEQLRQQAERVAAATRTALSHGLVGRAVVDLDRKLVQAAVEGIAGEYDKAYGGFGSASRRYAGPKFPVPSYLLLLLQEARRTRAAELLEMVTHTLDHMARGGIYDQLGGGFHRYSTERTWTVPHFEKMLYDNAQLLEVYAHAFALTKNPEYRRIVREIMEFVRRELASGAGGCFSALDADSSGVEGLSYVWTDADLDAALGNGDDAVLVKRLYGADRAPNFEQKAHILYLPTPLADYAGTLKMSAAQLEARLEPLRHKLLAFRTRRPGPFRDTKILAGWNGQMIAGAAVAGQLLGEPAYLDFARKAAEFALTNLRNQSGKLQRTCTIRPDGKVEAHLDGYLDDYAFLIHGLLAIHEASGEARWLKEARGLADTMIQLFWDRERGGFYYTSSEHEKLFARGKDQYDSAEPSGNSIATRDLVRLWQSTGDRRYRDLAEQNLKAFAGTLKENPTTLTAMAAALALYLDARK